MNCELPDVQAGLEKAEEPEIKFPTSAGSLKKREFQKKHLFLLYCFISALLTCFLRNLYAGQEATARTGHATTDWFQIGKGVCQGCISSPCLFNLYAEYIMRNAGLEEVQAGIKIAGRNIKTSDMQMTPPLWQKMKRN